MVDKLNLPEGYTLIDDTEEELLEEEIVEEVPKDKDVQLEEVSEEEPIGLNTLKEKGILSQDNVTGSLTEETVRGISKIVDKVQGRCS